MTNIQNPQNLKDIENTFLSHIAKSLKMTTEEAKNFFEKNGSAKLLKKHRANYSTYTLKYTFFKHENFFKVNIRDITNQKNKHGFDILNYTNLYYAMDLIKKVAK